MGNSVDNRASLLAKNWMQIDASTYKNTITQELIDVHQLHARNEEQISYNNSLLLKRAAINHPNVIKLIYFFQQLPSGSVCNDKKFKHKIYTEHASGTLASLLGSTSQDITSCFCCSVISGISCLVQKYGYFGVSPTMIFLVNSVGLSRKDEKKTAKVWINEDIRINHTQLICNQQEMCFHLYELYQLLAQKGFCNKLHLNLLGTLMKFKDFFEQVYNMHKKMPFNPQIERKRINSQLNNFQATKIQKNVTFVHQSQHKGSFNMKNNFTVPTNYSSRQSLLYRANNNFSNFVQNGISAKLGQQHEIAHSKADLGAKKTFNNFFLKGENTVKQVNIQRNAYKGEAKSKVNFSYTDNKVTPKNDKSFQQTKTNKVDDSPHLQLASISFHHKYSQIRPFQIEQRNFPQPISYFNSLQPVQVLTTNPNFVQSTQNHTKHIIQFRQQALGQSKKQVTKVENEQKAVLSKPTQLIVSNCISSSADEAKVAKVKKQLNLKLQKCVDMQWNVPLQSSTKSIGSNKQKPNAFQIVNEYRFSFQPDVKISSINIDQSQQFREESIKMTSANVLKERVEHPNSRFYIESQPQIGHDVQSKQFTNEHLVSQPALRTVSTRKASLPATAPNLDKKHHFIQKLQHFTQGIANSINSSGTNKSLQAKSEASQDMPTVHQNQKGGYSQKEDYSEANNSNAAHYGKRQSHKNQQELQRVSKNKSQQQSNDSESESMQQRKKVQILQKINKTQKILEQNKKKLQKLQLQNDLQIEKDMIKKEMESLLKNNVMVDETHRIKEKVKRKKATFAQLKAQASKILNDLNL